MTKQQVLADGRRNASARPEVVLLLTFVLLIGLYSLVRFQGLWGEIDTRNATLFIRDMYQSGELVPSGSSAYPNGYAYQALAVLLMNVSGLSLPTLQIAGALLLSIWVVIPAWLAYREFTGTGRAATLATAILLTQPEFLFVVMRGTHEKFTRGLMLLCLFLLLRSLRSRSRPVQFAGFVIAFYIGIYGVISFNNLISTSFVMAILLALLLIGILSITRTVDVGLATASLQRLNIVLVTSLVLAFMFTMYLYRPAQHDLAVLETMVDRVAALFLDIEATSTSPYGRWVSGTWINLPVYFIMTIANWILLVASASIWLWQTMLWLTRRKRPDDERDVLLWALFGAFAFMGAMSILIDYSGVLSANLQHRSFPSFAMLAAPLVAKWLVDRRPDQSQARRAYFVAIATVFMVLAILSTLKSTNEPLVSNKWLYYSPAEMRAVNWSERGLENRTLWVSYDERLAMSIDISRGGLPVRIDLDVGPAHPGTRDFLQSDVANSRQLRSGLPAIVTGDDYITYDNGRAQILHRRPETPYQR